MAERELIGAMTKFLEQDAQATKTIATAAMDIGRDNREMNKILKLTIENMDKTMITHQSFMKEALERIEKRYVVLDRFTPVEKLVYGVVGLILIAFVGALTFIVWGR